MLYESMKGLRRGEGRRGRGEKKGGKGRGGGRYQEERGQLVVVKQLQGKQCVLKKSVIMYIHDCPYVVVIF